MLPEHIARAGAKRPNVRSSAEHVFADSKYRMGLFIYNIGIIGVRIKIGAPEAQQRYGEEEDQY